MLRSLWKSDLHFEKSNESDSHFEKSELHFRSFALLLLKKPRFAQKTKERIPNPDSSLHIWTNYLIDKIVSATSKYIREFFWVFANSLDECVITLK